MILFFLQILANTGFKVGATCLEFEENELPTSGHIVISNNFMCLGETDMSQQEIQCCFKKGK